MAGYFQTVLYNKSTYHISSKRFLLSEQPWRMTSNTWYLPFSSLLTNVYQIIKHSFVLVWPFDKKHTILEGKPRIFRNKERKLDLHQVKIYMKHAFHEKITVRSFVILWKSLKKHCHQGRNEVRWRPGQEASFSPPCYNLSSFGSKCTVLKKVLVLFLVLFGAPAVICYPHSD